MERDRALHGDMVFGVDFGAEGADKSVVQMMVQKPRDKAKELLYALFYGAEPNRNGDYYGEPVIRRVFNTAIQKLRGAEPNPTEPLPHIEYGAPLSSKPLNDIIDKVNELSEQFMLGHAYSMKHRDISMGCSVKPTPCPVCDHEEKERLKKNSKENPFYIREYMGMWPPLEEEPKQFPEETYGQFTRRMMEWKKEQREKERQINYQIQSMQDGKEKTMPGVESMKGDPRHEEQVKKLKDNREKLKKSVREWEYQEQAYSPGTKTFIEAQKKARPGQLVGKVAAEAQEAQEEKKLDKVAKEVHWKPKHCRKCGHSQGCMCPREPEPIEDACKHGRLVQVPLCIAKELDPCIISGWAQDLLFYACQDCHRLVLRLPMGQVRNG